MCLTAASGSAAEAKKKSAEKSLPELQQEADEAARNAEALKQQVQAAQSEAQQRAQGAQVPQAPQAEEKKQQSGPEPSLNIPIRYFVYTALFSGLGYATGFLSAGPERSLRNPAKHPNPDKTLTLYREARYGGMISKGFYGLSGAMGGFAAYKTQSAVREYLTAKAQAQMAERQRQVDQRLAQAKSPEERKAVEVANTLWVPPEPGSAELTELLATPPEPLPLQAGFFVGPSGDAAVSLSMSF
jgi:hypothetical protein